MYKFFDFFTNKKRKDESLPNKPLGPVPVQVYRNYEFDSENGFARCGGSFTFDFENKVNKGLNLSKDSSKSQFVTSHFKNASLKVSPANKRKTLLEKTDKSSKNMYVINIRNCKYFHIGSIETINSGHTKKSLPLPVDLDLLLDCHQKISEETIMVISLNMGDSWKNFGTSLGLKDNYLEEVKFRNQGNTIFMTFDILQKYMGLFPNTSVGFIISVLNEIKQMKVIQEIAKTKTCYEN